MELEKQIKQLEEIVEKMQDEDIKLDESLALFESGLKIAQACSTTLKEQRGKLTVLTEKMKNILND